MNRPHESRKLIMSYQYRHTLHLPPIQYYTIKHETSAWRVYSPSRVDDECDNIYDNPIIILYTITIIIIRLRHPHGPSKKKKI